MSEGRKDDNDKPRYDLLPPEALDALARVLTFGAEKYEDRNWEKGMRWGRPYAALQRHLWAWWGGENTDPETGESHLAHAMCCVAFLLAYESRSTGEDDRPASPKIAAAFKSRRGADASLTEREAMALERNAMIADMNRRQPQTERERDEEELRKLVSRERHKVQQREAMDERAATLRREIEDAHKLRVK